jgi:hypothetical protein
MPAPRSLSLDEALAAHRAEPPVRTAYYATCQDAGRTGWLLGPFETHAEALACVDDARRLAEAADPFAHFYAFGTASHTGPGPFPLGVLNARFAEWRA